MRRVVAGALVAVLAAALLAGCSLLPQPTSTSTPYLGGVTAADRPFYGQSLVWRDCQDGFQCATAKAPLDWADPGSGATIHLALIRHTATGQRLGSLFVNPGGPGASGVEFLRSGLSSFFDQTLIEHYDLVSWDPRGVGSSSAVDCLGTAGLDAYLFDDPTLPADSAQMTAEVDATSKAFGQACERNTGALLAHVDTESTVGDLDMLRAAVGDQKLHYFGFSYGTYIGALYAERFPTTVGRMALDGAVDPSLTDFQKSLANNIGFGDALKAYLANCLKSTSCPFAGLTVQGAIDEIAQIANALRASPLRTSTGREVNSVVFRYAIDASLYDRGTWTYLTQAFAGVLQGNGSVALALSDSYFDRGAESYTSNEWEAIFAVSCIDGPVTTDPAQILAQDKQLVAADPLGAADDEVGTGNAVCRNWPVAPTGKPHRVSTPGAPAILVLGTTGDPATPYAWAKSLAGQLSKGILLTYRGQGHTAYRNHVACINTRVDSYFVTGTVPADGISCG